MSDEEQSVAFLHHHMETSFEKVMSEYLVLDIEWLEGYTGRHNEGRAIARLAHPFFPDQESNMICLFPPFFPNSTNKE